MSDKLIITMAGEDTTAMAERHKAQLESMRDESPETVEKVMIQHRLERLGAQTELGNSEDIDFLITHGKLVKFKGFMLCNDNLVVYKAKTKDISEGFYIKGPRGLFKYPEAFFNESRLPIVREDPSTPTLDDLGAWSGTSQTYLIGKIKADRLDSIRLVYADPESSIIRAIFSSNSPVFNKLDVGNFCYLNKNYVNIQDVPFARSCFSATVPVARAELIGFPIRGDDGYPESGSCYEKIRKDYIDRFVKGQYKDIQVKCFKFTRRSFSYSDTVIECSWQTLRKALTIVMDSYHDDFTNMFPEILKGAHGFAFKINGTTVKVDQKEAEGASKLYYVNDHRISAPDLTEVLEHALCFPKATKIYDDYLTTVSKVSLKFHRAVAKGLPFIMESELLPTTTTVGVGGDEIRRPGGMRKNSGGYMGIMLKVNKTFGKKTNFDFLGKTRYVDEFDAFKRVAGSDISACDRSVKLPRVQKGLPHEGLIKRLQAIDVDLMPGSKYLEGMEIGNAEFKEFKERANVNGVYRSDGLVMHEAILNTEANANKARELWQQLGLAFSSCISDEHKILARSHELLQQVMKDAGATCVQEGDDYFYKVAGISGARYKIKERDASVQLDTEGSEHICIVKASNDIDGYDYISSLIIALSQDKFTARNIHTLTGHVSRAQAAKAAQAE